MRVKTMTATLLFALFITSLSAADLVLSRNGKTNYQIVIEGANPKNIWDGQFLAWFLEQKTGAKFPVVGARARDKRRSSIILGNSRALRQIVGEIPYGGMKDQDHVVRSKGKDIILYGKGYDADFYAIAEFLDRCLGFRIYQSTEVPKIKKTPTLILKPFSYKLSWALKFRMFPQRDLRAYIRGENHYTSVMANKANDYRRFPLSAPKFSFTRHHIPIQPQTPEVGVMHTALLYIPTKSHPPYVGFPFVRHKDYFVTNPEFFCLRNGKRSPLYLCWSNKGLRKEFTKNIEKHFDALGTDHVRIKIAMVDGVDVCHCKECKRLAKKYGTPGGAFFEYVMEVGELFMKTHPLTRISAGFYQKGQTLIAPELPPGKTFPPNIDFCYCDIYGRTNRFWDGKDPQSRQAYEWLKRAAKISKNMHVWLYHPHYGVSRILPMSTTNIIVDKLRKIAQLGLKGAFLEFGPTLSGLSYGYVNFADLEIYLFYRFSKYPDLDFDKEVADYCKNVYGPAWKFAKQYHDELTKACTTDNKYGFILSPDDFNTNLSYLNADNLYRWQKLFDKMADLVKNSDPLYKKNVTQLRKTLDIATYARWNLVNKKYPAYFKDHKMVRARVGKIANNVWGNLPKRYLAESALRIEYAGKEKPLPAQFSKIDPGRIRRFIPKNYANHAGASKIPKTVKDKDAAMGYGATVDQPDLPFRFGYYVFATKKGISRRITEKEIVPGKYQFYKLGTIQPYNSKCLLWFSAKSWCTHLDMKTAFDLAEPQAEYECYVSLKFPKDFKGRKNDIVLCDQIILVKKK